ncbi:XTP/dITP diphosphohydrolase [Virgibacillus natechei]|uniref:dITP/XTP pyrophosphatase n=1 Tax=Virgibacillus natechei TaxID=1216297 RepID=A0ABS4ID08_9BACI|nr:XTP/dITP diphosphatase [Virgibacillus natechei]MBP1968822.1 XTP/dITP diphosphohydrolase [Virgibacillus natechei]UZD11621.1 XTP/dITP diphosphatase [Virgibacillus natechei]
MKKIIIATRNAGKAKEFKDLFIGYGIQAISLLDLTEEIPEVEETGTTFEENAALKAEQLSDRLSIPVLADDSGLIIDALGGRPGVFSARYSGMKNDQKNIEKVLGELENIPTEERTARFVCVLAVAVPGQKTIFRKGDCEGSIAFFAIGDNGFGYDPVFIPKNYTCTMAQLSDNEKNSISHRKNAIVELDEFIKNDGGGIFR